MSSAPLPSPDRAAPPALTALPIPLVLTESDGRIVEWNDAARRLLRSDARETQFLTEAVDAASRPRIAAAAQQAVSAGSSEGVSVRLARGSAEARHVLLSATHWPGRGVLWTALDHESESRRDARLAAIVESAPNAVLLVDPDGRISLVNSQAEQLFRAERKQLLGLEIEMLVPERFRESHPRFRREFLSDPHSRPMGAGRDLFALRRDGTEVPVEIGLSPVRTDEGVFVIAAIVDITERRRAEERFRSAVESAPNAMLLVDRSGRIVLANRQAEHLFGFSRDALLSIDIEQLVPERFRSRHPADRNGFFDAPRVRTMGAGRDLYALRSDGVEVPVEIGLNPIQTDDGDFVLAAIVDISERRQAQRSLAQKTDEVEGFVYIVSHDLRAPLVNLQGFGRELHLSCDELRTVLGPVELTDDVRRRVDAILDGDIPGSLHFITASTNKFERLVTALLGLSRLGRQEYREEWLDITSIVQSTLDSVRRSIDRAGADVVVEDLPRAWGDPTAVGQVFANLIANALAYLEPTRPGRIVIRGESLANAALFHVSDNGVGIPPGVRDRTFQVFQRFHPSMAEGEGMGLAIIRTIVRRHGGDVWVDSQEGVGTTFTFSLDNRRAPREAGR